MAKRTNQVKAYLTDKEKAKLKQWSQDVDKSQSALVREAILEYLDRDRTARIEDKLDRVLMLVENDSNTHTGGSQNSIPETAREIAQHIYDNYDSPIPESDVELAIENIASVGSDRAKENYFDQLRKRDLLYKHPAQEIWTDSKREWVKWVENSMVEVDVYDVTDGYSMKTEEYNRIADEIVQ